MLYIYIHCMSVSKYIWYRNVVLYSRYSMAVFQQSSNEHENNTGCENMFDAWALLHTAVKELTNGSVVGQHQTTNLAETKA